ncbi:uric acid degradation bifunctional protein TTL isoform X1 [Lycium ferocissimum]|uniref:uric acid degradation bifunctional protein TTL isoform X1 n=1 Tax=Lycium ferocissimum TaxID=112874 RepID=UPI002814BA5E|nr:uric acid degradation bifunctional protein TTL isoform X1 [Lycium ferocissimum]
MGSSLFDEKDFLACCGSTKFAKEMVLAGPFSTHQDAIHAARHIWFNKVDVTGWLEAFAAHPQIGQTPHKTPTFAQWSKGEQSTALATANESTLQELFEWNARYREKFGFVFLICASGRSTPEILAELKIRYQNRPIIEFEIAAQEQMKITELRLSKLFSDKADTAPTIKPLSTTNIATKAEEDRVNIVGAHLTAATGAKPAHIPKRTRPPITTHVLDTSRGCPANDIEVRLEMWKDNLARPQFGEADIGGWILLGSSATDKDGRSGQLMNMVEALVPGVYRISFNTGKYNPDGFFPYVSIVFEIKESQKWDHFHVPLLLSPFSLSTYRGS